MEPRHSATLTFLATLAIASCSGSGDVEEPDRPPGGFVRLDLVGDTGTAHLPEPVIIAHFEPGDEPELWSVDPGPALPGPLPGHPEDSPTALVVEEFPKGEWKRELALDSSRFEDVEVILWTEREIELSITYRLGNKKVGKSGRVFLKRSTQPQKVLLPPGPELETFAFDSFALTFTYGRKAGLGILSVDMIAPRPPSAYLPAEQSAPRLEFLDIEGRRSWWLGVGRPMSSPVEVGPGSELHLSYMRPMNTRRTGVEADLLVHVDDAAGRRITTERLPLESGPEEPSAWKSARILLPGPLEEPGRVQFAIETNAGLDAVCLVAEPGVWTPPETPPPSVLLVTTDTHRADHIGAAEDGVDVQTPALDSLAARGLMFTDCFSPANSTNPSHVSLMTGTHPRDTGILDNYTALTEAAPTLAEAFHDAGYVTWATTSAGHLQPDFSGLGQGFDRVAAPISGSRDSSETIADLQRWLPDAGERSLFVWLHVFDAHTPYAPPEEYRLLYYPEGKDPRDASIELPNAVLDLSPMLKDVRDMDYVRAQYTAEVDYLDDQLAPILELPRFKNGITAVVADHGEALGEKDVYFRHEGLYPSSLHIPLIMAFPGAPAGTRVDRPVTHVGLGRTLLDLAGLESVPFAGEALWSRDGEIAPGGPRFFLGGAGNDSAILAGDDLLILHMRRHQVPRGGHDHLRHSLELYDLSTDRECNDNRVQEDEEKAKRLYAALRTWLSDQVPGWAGEANVDPEFAAQLADLGYTEMTEDGAELLTDPDGCFWCEFVR